MFVKNMDGPLAEGAKRREDRGVMRGMTSGKLAMGEDQLRMVCGVWSPLQAQEGG